MMIVSLYSIRYRLKERIRSELNKLLLPESGRDPTLYQVLVQYI